MADELSAIEAVLRGEEGDQIYAGSVGEDVAGFFAAGIDAGLVGDEADALALEGREMLALEHVDAEQDLGAGPRRPQHQQGAQDEILLSAVEHVTLALRLYGAPRDRSTVADGSART